MNQFRYFVFVVGIWTEIGKEKDRQRNIEDGEFSLVIIFLLLNKSEQKQSKENERKKSRCERQRKQ